MKFSAEQNLAWWMSFLPAAKADLCEELGGNESCLISAESLILRFGAGREFRGSFGRSPRFLWLMFQIERFLATLNDVGIVNVELIFFDDLKALLMRQNPALWTFRESFRLHAILHPETFAHKIFKNWHAPDFIKLQASRHPFVFLTDDGSNLEPPRSVLAEREIDDAAAEHGYGPLYSLALNCIGRQMNVAFLYKLQKSGRRINAFIVGPERYHAGLEKETAEAIEREAEEAADAIEEQLSGSWSLASLSDSLSFRLSLLSAAAGEIVDSEESPNSWSSLFFKALLLHALVLDSVSLEERSLGLANPESETYIFSLEFLFAHLQRFLTGLLNSGTPQQLRSALTGQEAQVTDLVDELLLREVLYAMIATVRATGVSVISADFFGLDSDAIEALETAWAPAGRGLSFFPIDWKELVEDDDSFFHEAPEELCLCMLVPFGRIPKVLPVEHNDFVHQMLEAESDSRVGVFERGPETETREGESLAEKFFAAENAMSVAPVGGPESVATRFSSECEFDLAANHVKTNAVRREQKLPRWIEKLSGEQRDRAAKRWEMKKTQESKLFARNINKYFGSLDKLHLPIVLVGGRAQGHHPWLASSTTELQNSDESPSASAAKKPKELIKKEKKDKKDEKEKEKKVSNKAAVIIAKNLTVQAEKQKSKQLDVSEHLYSLMEHVFKKRTAKPSVFNEAFLELLVGPRNASDANVLEDFIAIKKVLTFSQNQAEFLTALAEKLMDPLEHTWKEKQVLAM